MKKVFILIILFIIYSCNDNPKIVKCDYGWCLSFGHTQLKRTDFDSIFTINKLSKTDSAVIGRILYLDSLHSNDNKRHKRGWKY